MCLETEVNRQVVRRIYQLLRLREEDVRLELIFGVDTLDVRLVALSEVGGERVDTLVENPRQLCAMTALIPVDEVLLYRSELLCPIRFKLADEQLFRFPGVAMHESLKSLVPLVTGLKGSLFVIDYDGTYLEYLECGHFGPTVVSYDDMIGTKAIQKLPPEMAAIVQHYHDRAVETGEPQDYGYVSPVSGRQMWSLVVPYPELRQVALLVLDAQETPVKVGV